MSSPASDSKPASRAFRSCSGRPAAFADALAQRLGEEQLAALLQESLSVAHQTGALATRDLERVVVDTTVQPKAIRASA